MVTPLKTLSGISVSDFYKSQPHKTIIIWGTGYLGLCFLRAFRKAGVKDIQFCESIVSKKYFKEVSVIEMSEAMSAVLSGNAIIICASANHYSSMKGFLTNSGLQQGKDFFLHFYFRRIEAQIDITGQTEQMSLLTFQKIMNKLSEEDVFCLTIGVFHEPFDNCELFSYVEEAEKYFPVHVVTWLSSEINILPRYLPSLLSVKVNQFDEKKIDMILSLEKLIKDDSLLNLSFELTSNNLQDFNIYKKKIAGTKVRLIQGYKYPDYDSIVNEKNQDFASLAWNFDEAMKAAESSKIKSCLCQRVFPIIQSDLTVLQCHLYRSLKLEENFLKIDFSKLLESRDMASLCGACQSMSLQRLDVEVLCKDPDVRSKIFSGGQK